MYKTVKKCTRNKKRIGYQSNPNILTKDHQLMTMTTQCRNHAFDFGGGLI